MALRSPLLSLLVFVCASAASAQLIVIPSAGSVRGGDRIVIECRQYCDAPLQSALVGGAAVPLRLAEDGYEGITPPHDSGPVAIEAIDSGGRTISGGRFVYEESPFTGERPVAPRAVDAAPSQPTFVAAANGNQAMVAWLVVGTPGTPLVVVASRLDRQGRALDPLGVPVLTGPTYLSALFLVGIGDHWLLADRSDNKVHVTVIDADGRPGRSTEVGVPTAPADFPSSTHLALSAAGDRALVAISDRFGTTGYVLDGAGNVVATTPRLLQGQYPNVRMGGSNGTEFLALLQTAEQPSIKTFIRVGRDGSILGRRDVTATVIGDDVVWDGSEYIVAGNVAGRAMGLVLTRDLSIGPDLRLTAASDLQYGSIAVVGSDVIVLGSKYPRLTLTRVRPPHDATEDVPVSQGGLLVPENQDLFMVSRGGGLAITRVDPVTLAVGPSRNLDPHLRVPLSWSLAGSGDAAFIVWEESLDSTHAYNAVKGRLLARSGAASEALTLSNGGQRPLPAVAADNSHYYAVWRSSINNRIVMQRFNPDGSLFDAQPFPLTAPGSAPPDLRGLSVGVGGDTVMVIWTRSTGEMQGTAFSASRDFLRLVPFGVSAGATGNLGGMFAISRNAALAAWLQPQVGSSSTDAGVPRNVAAVVLGTFGAIITPSAVPLAPPKPGCGAPSVATNAHDFLVVWWEPAGSGGVVRAASIDNNGTAHEALTIAATGSGDAAPSAAWSNGAYFIAWRDGGRILIQRRAADLSLIRDPEVLWDGVGATAAVRLTAIADGIAAAIAHPAEDLIFASSERLFIRFTQPPTPRVRAAR